MGIFDNHEKEFLNLIHTLAVDIKLMAENSSEQSRNIHELINRIPIPHNPHSQLAVKLIVSQIKINNNIVKGTIMSVQFGKAQKVTATITGLNAANLPVDPGNVLNLRATIDNTSVVNTGAVDPTAQTIELIGAADGTASITYLFENNAGTTISFTDTITISDEVPPTDNLAVSGSVSYSTPVAQ